MRVKILVFLQGTILMHKSAAGLSREEIIRQVIDQEASVRDFKNYIPVGNAPQKLEKWAQQGAEIGYLSALTENKKGRGDEIVGQEGLQADETVLNKYGFPSGVIYHRGQDESYADVVAKIVPCPDILIEDDCASMGQEAEVTYPGLNQGLQGKIKSIVVKEFGGIDHLPDSLELLTPQSLS
ncbi:MAG: hypothetical protein Q8N84_04105 [bacterium]|nr:hypothetical protein [bacterium]